MLQAVKLVLASDRTNLPTRSMEAPSEVKVADVVPIGRTRLMAHMIRFTSLAMV